MLLMIMVFLTNVVLCYFFVYPSNVRLIDVMSSQYVLLSIVNEVMSFQYVLSNGLFFYCISLFIFCYLFKDLCGLSSGFAFYLFYLLACCILFSGMLIDYLMDILLILLDQKRMFSFSIGARFSCSYLLFDIDCMLNWWLIMWFDACSSI